MRALSTAELRSMRPDRDTFADQPRHPVALVLENLTSGFNVGAAFRLADAFRLDSVHLCGTTPAPPKARITKTSMGTERWVPYSVHPDTVSALDALCARGFHAVAVELTDAAIPLERFNPGFPLALVLGDEMVGVSSTALQACESSVVIPMYGMGNSMSVVTAMAVVAHHVVASYRNSPVTTPHG